MDGLLEAHIWASCHKLDRRPQEHEEALRLDSARTAWALLNDLNERIQKVPTVHALQPSYNMFEDYTHYVWSIWTPYTVHVV